MWAGPRVRAVSPESLLLRLVISVAAAWVRPGSCGEGGSLGGAAWGRGLARIFAFAVVGLRLGARGRPGHACGGGWCLGGAGQAVSSGSLLLRSVGFGGAALRCRPARAPLVAMAWSRRGSLGLRSSPYLCLTVNWASGGPASPRGLARFFVVAVGAVWVGSARSRAVLSGSLLLQLVGFSRDCAWAWGPRVLLVAVTDVWAGPRVRAVSPESLLLRLVGFRSRLLVYAWVLVAKAEVCVGPRGGMVRPDLCYCGWWA